MRTTKLRRQATGLLIGYSLQFLLGMLLNLFVTLPKTHPGSSGKEYISSSSHGLVWALSGAGGWQLTIHAVLALLLVVGSLPLVISSVASKSKNWIWASSIAAFFTIGAFFNGLSFIDYNHDVSSMIMAICWLIAVGSLVYGLTRPSKV